MGPLFTVTTEPIHIERMTEPGRLVSSESLDMERRRLLARRMAFGLRNQEGQAAVSIPQADLTSINQAFSKGSPASSPVPAGNAAQRHAPLPSQDASDAGTQGAVRQETDSQYIAERGAFEMRVHRGDLTFVPPLVMTVITQYPEIHFEYTGGFLYVPPSAEPQASLLDRVG